MGGEFAINFLERDNHLTWVLGVVGSKMKEELGRSTRCGEQDRGDKALRIDLFMAMASHGRGDFATSGSTLYGLFPARQGTTV